WRTARTSRHADGRSGYTSTWAGSPPRRYHAARPSGPRTRIAGPGSVCRPRRPARTRASRRPSASAGSTATSGTRRRRHRSDPAPAWSASSVSEVATPRERTPGTWRWTTGAARLTTASTTKAAATATVAKSATPGATSADSAHAPNSMAARTVAVTGATVTPTRAAATRATPARTGASIASLRARSAGDGHRGQRGLDGVVGPVPLELRFGSQEQPVAQHGAGHPLHVVRRHEVAPADPRRRLRRREEMHGGP